MSTDTFMLTARESPRSVLFHGPTSQALPSLGQASLADQVFRGIYEMIVKGDLMPGDFLPPRKHLAARFGVGLSTIQEAIKALTALGLLDSRSGKGTWVREDAVDRLGRLSVIGSRLGELGARVLYEARLAIEVPLVEFATERATSDEIEEIKQALRLMEEVRFQEEAYAEADLSFHLAVAKAAHNPILSQFYGVVWQLMPEVLIELNRLPASIDDGLELQQAIGEAIEQRDVARARQLTADLLREFLHRVEQVPEGTLRS